MTVTPQSRIQVLDAPIAAPGVCSMCGSAGGDGRKFLDYGKQLDWYGAVYFCSECIKEFAQAADFIPVEAFNSQAIELANLQITYDQLVRRNKVMENALRNVLGRNSDPVDDLVSSAMATVEESNAVVESSRIDDDGDKETTESPSIQGSDDFFDSSDFE